MDGSFISPPAKRQYHNLSTTMQELNNNPHPTSNGTTTSSKRRNNSNTNSNSRNPLTTPHGHTALRLLCHVSKIGGVIGKSGSVVKLFRQETGAKIRIEEPVNACDERIILVVAQENPKKIITLKGLNDEEDESGDEYEVSPAQEAFLRVFERILDVEAESEGIFPPPGGNVSCRMLAVTSQIGGVMGKGGKNIEKVRKESGAKIRVMPSDQRPACASSGDEVIQILGDVFAVKKALIAISRRLQDNPPTEKAQAAGSRPVGTLHGAFPEAYAELPHRSSLIQPTIGTLQGTFPEVYGELPHRSSLVQSTIGAVQGTFSEVYGELPHRSSLVQPSIGTVQGTFPEVYGELPHRSSLVQPTIGSSLDYPSRGDYTSRNRPLPTEVDRISALDAQRQQEIVFKLLCSNDSVGGVIGKGGAIVRALQDETGATISVGSSVSEADERVVTVSAKENPESRYSPAQNAVVRVFTRSVEVGIEKGQDASKGASVSARLLVPPNQVGCLMGKGGTIIQEMRKLTNTAIRIIGGDKVSKSNSENDQVVQIVGDLRNVQNAVFHVTGRLRDNLFPNKTMNGAGAGAGTGTGAGAGIYSSSTIHESSPYGRLREQTSPALYPSLGLHRNIDRQTMLAHGIDHLGLSHSLDHSRSPQLWTSQTIGGGNSRGMTDSGRGLTSLRGSLDFGSGGKTAIVTNTTVEILVPEQVLGSVYGENGTNLNRLRQISGAKVSIHDPRPGTSETIVVISGTPDQTQAAQSLLQAFILSGQS